MRVEKSETVTLIGHNGAGKSTTLQVIADLVRPTSDAIIFDGHDIAQR